MLTVELFARLLGPAGQAALADAVRLAPDDSTFLRHFQTLTRRHDPELAKAALEQAALRRRAGAKFPLAGRMYFTSDALEQATPAAVAEYRAGRIGPRRVFEACCGIGGDTQALARRSPVVAVDADPLRIALARCNVAAVEGGPGVEFRCADVTRMRPHRPDVLVFDPDRRATGRRSAALRDLRPPIALVESWGCDAAVVKLAPATPWNDLEPLPAGIEFISLAGELKECAAWFGSLRGARRQATVLPAGASLAADEPAPGREPAEPRHYLYDPDPAVTRAGLVTDLAERLDAAQLDPAIAFLTADTRTETPFARRYAVECWLPFHLGRLRELLRERRVGRVTILKRGSPVDADDVARGLKLRGDEFRTLILTRVGGRPAAVVARPD
jgi:SAM-dependent methyltransferase